MPAPTRAAGRTSVKRTSGWCSRLSSTRASTARRSPTKPSSITARTGAWSGSGTSLSGKAPKTSADVTTSTWPTPAADAASVSARPVRSSAARRSADRRTSAWARSVHVATHTRTSTPASSADTPGPSVSTTRQRVPSTTPRTGASTRTSATPSSWPRVAASSRAIRRAGTPTTSPGPATATTGIRDPGGSPWEERTRELSGYSSWLSSGTSSQSNRSHHGRATRSRRGRRTRARRDPQRGRVERRRRPASGRSPGQPPGRSPGQPHRAGRPVRGCAEPAADGLLGHLVRWLAATGPPGPVGQRRRR